MASIESTAPVSSPTPTIWATIGGNALALFSGSAIVPPAFTEVITSSIERSMTALPAVLPVISIACRIGTPAEVSDDSVRDQRAIATFWTTSPIFIGMRSLNASQCGRAHLDLRIHRNVPTRDHEDHDQQVPLLGDQVRHVDHDLRQRRQLAAELLEDALEHRDQERDQREQHADREA